MVILFIASIVVIEAAIAIMAIVVNVVIVVIMVFTRRCPKWYLMSCYGGLRYADVSLTSLSDMKTIYRRCLGNSGRAFNHATSQENPDNEVPTLTQRQRGRVVSALDSQSGGPGFESRCI